MTIRKAKTSPKIFESDSNKLKKIALRTMDRISDIVGSTFGPGGKNTLIESDYPGLPNKNTKDGVTVFRSLGSYDPYEHLVIEQARDAAQRTATEAGDGPQSLYSKVLTPRGFIQMKDVQVGMEICGTNGSTQMVLGVFPKGKKEIYKVEFSGGREVECCPDHLWSVITNYGANKTVTTAEMLKDFIHIDNKKNKSYRYYVPTSVVSFLDNKTERPLDPYLVGLLLGDGSLSDKGSVELSLGINKKHVLEKIVLPEGLNLHTTFVENRNSYRVKIKGKTKQGLTPHRLVESLGLLNASSHLKFIPKSYLYAPEDVRRSLLQGLLDTDGYINSRGRFEFSTVSSELKNDFLELVWGLNIPVNYKLHSRDKDLGSYSDRPIHRITELKGYDNGVKVVNITPTGKFTEMQCIKVSNEDCLYITDNYIPTHNTTSSTIISAALIRRLFEFCEKNRKYSPQKAARLVNKTVRDTIAPAIRNRSIAVTEDNKGVLEKVAKVSANGDEDMAKAVIEAFDAVGYGENSHVTIKELSGPGGYSVELIDGFPIPIGYEESIGKFHPAFINDQANQRCLLEKPLFLLFDGKITNIMTLAPVLERVGQKFMDSNQDTSFMNVVIFAHGFSEDVLNHAAFNFNSPHTINFVPVVTPMNLLINSQTHFLHDLAAFTGAKVFGMDDHLGNADIEHMGRGMEVFECYRFRSTVVGDSDSVNIEVRADEIRKQMENAESVADKRILEERLGKLTNGIAKLTIRAGSSGELKEAHDRCEDAVCSVRCAISDGVLPGGCRVLLDMSINLMSSEDPVLKEVIAPALMEPIIRLLENAGYQGDEIGEIISKLQQNPDLVYDVENQVFGTADETGVFDATKAVTESVLNAASIASVMGSLGGIVAYPRDNAFELSEAKADSEFERSVTRADEYVNEANLRP